MGTDIDESTKYTQIDLTALTLKDISTLTE